MVKDNVVSFNSKFDDKFLSRRTWLHGTYGLKCVDPCVLRKEKSIILSQLYLGALEFYPTVFAKSVLSKSDIRCSQGHFLPHDEENDKQHELGSVRSVMDYVKDANLVMTE